MSSTEGSTNNVASEDINSVKWDRCFERGAIKLGYGALAGGLTAAILFRRPVSRSIVFGLGAGIAIGISYADCKYEFDNPNKVQIISRKV